MDRAIRQWLTQQHLPAELAIPLTKELNKSYSVYGCMLLLPPTAFQGAEWKAISSIKDSAADNQTTERFAEKLHHLFPLIAKEVKTTHIAINRPIPLSDQAQKLSPHFNVLRSPSNFEPIYGDFGPEITPSSLPSPTKDDFDSAFWVTAKQNSIYQTWAPRYTMFSRGNISEKARLVTLPSVLSSIQDGNGDGRGCCAVDLYAGIGYFAFSYLRAGITKVLCWDLNPWSCEGLRRGATANKWRTITLGRETNFIGELCEGENDEAKIVIFNETNELAPLRVRKMKDAVPPIRHVNCGMLPSSREGLALAAKVLTLDVVGRKGWIHVHENFLVEEIETKAEETRVALQRTFDQEGEKVRTEVDSVNRLKSYAPGVMHCVVDVVVEKLS